MDSKTFIDESAEDVKKIIIVDKEKDYDERTGMKKRELVIEEEREQTFCRVQTEALDFDWLFEG